MLQQASTANEYIDMVNMLGENYFWDNKASKEFRARAQALLETDLGNGNMLMGIVHAMDGNVPQMRECFEKALAYNPDKTRVLSNYCTALYMTGFFSEVIQRLLPVYTPDKQMSLVMANANKALGLDAKARQFYEDGNFEQSFEDYYATFVPPKSAHHDKVFALLEKSLTRDAEVWEYLSNR